MSSAKPQAPQITGEVTAQLAALESMGATELRALWRSCFGRQPPGRVQRDFLVLGLAYRMQEKAFGGLSSAIQRRLVRYADELSKSGSIPSLLRTKIKPGTRLVREWGGETHVVTALDRGFEYRGRRFDSLSKIACSITATRWSGPAFFGLRPADKNNAGKMSSV